MASSAAGWVWGHSHAANSSLLVLLAIADEADKGNAEMSVLELARKAKLGERAVQGAIAALMASGELEVLSAGGGRGHRHVFRIPVKGADSAGFETETPQNLRGIKGADSAGFTEPGPTEPQVRSVKGADSAGFETADVISTPTGRSPAGVKEAPAKPPRPDADRLCGHLADRIEANGSRRPAITQKWRDAARLLIDRDGRTEEQVHKAIDWCQDSEFWRTNILSMPKLREQYERLRLQADRERRAPRQSRRQQDTDDLFDRAMRRAEEREEAARDAQGNGHDLPVRQGALPAAGH